ncbi:MAG TPA: hypothetical protein VGO03_07995 [Acidimicrobiia bacterium]|jgi:hypothetical protein
MVRPTTVLSLVFAVLLGAAGITVGIVLIALHHQQHGSQWHYWLAPVLMIGASATLWNLTMQYWRQIGRREMRSRPPRD